MFRGIFSIFAVTSLFALGAVVPASWVEGIPLCFFHEITGWDCPGCGLTRAWIAFFHGEFREAFQLNALVPLFILLLLFYFLHHLGAFRKRPAFWTTTPEGQKWIGRSFLVLFIGQWFWKLGRQWMGG